ncbi:MAG: inverse autotransporter beta domain-containing protein [Sedimenticola sp.]
MAGAVSVAVLVSLASLSVQSASSEDQPAEAAIRNIIELAQASGTGELGNQVVNQALSRATSLAEGQVDEWIPTFELSAQVTHEGKPVFGMLGLVPLVEDEHELLFTQGSIFHSDDRSTINLGLGYRWLVSDDKVLLGANAFYDHEFPYDHRRASIGLEARASVAELNMNFYEGLSGWRSGRDGLNERAMDGYDLEVGVDLPYMPSVRAYARHFEWNAIDGATDLKGTRYSLAGSFYPGVTVEVGRNNYQDSSQQDANFAKLTVDFIELTRGSARSTPLLSDTAYRLDSMRDQRYQKVRRENIIQKQTSGGSFTATVSGI